MMLYDELKTKYSEALRSQALEPSSEELQFSLCENVRKCP